MRATLFVLAIVAIGCAGTKDAQRPAQGKPSVPVVHENPTLMDRAQHKRQQDDARAMVGMTVVEGNIDR